MQLTELCEPLFQYVCLLNRSARKGAVYRQEQVRAEVKKILGEMRAGARVDGRLVRPYERIEPALIFFVDSMIREGRFVWSPEWVDLAKDYGLEDGDEKFFDQLDEVLKDTSREAMEILPIFYTCLGLGFVGWYAERPELIRKRMMEISAKIRGVTDSMHASRIVPEAYQNVNTANLIETPGKSLGGIGLVLIGLMAVLFATNMYLYRSSSKNLNEAVQRVIDAGGAVPQPTTLPGKER